MADSQWAPICLGAVCSKIGSGATPRGGSDVYLEKGPYALIRSQNVYNDGFHHDGLAFIGEEHAAELKNVEVLDHDVLLNITGDSVARACQVDPSILPARVNQHVAIIRPDPDRLAPRFLRYFLVSPEMQTKLLSWAGSGGTRNALTKGMIESFEVFAPVKIDEQRAIAHILGMLDDKIELNRQMDETLGAMTQAIFKSWFVDFDPVRAKAEGRDPSLPKYIADLFPDRFEDSELGEIPAGWDIGCLEDIASVTMGISPNGESYNAEGLGIPLINGPVEFGYYFPVKTKWTISPTRMAQVGDLIFCVRGSTTGRRVVADDSYCLGRGVCAIRAKNDARTFLYQTVNISLGRLLSNTTGSVFPNLSAPDLKGFPVVVPTRRVLEIFERIAEPLTERIESNVKESRTLAALRDALLPKLISSELRIKDAERIVEAAL